MRKFKTGQKMVYAMLYGEVVHAEVLEVSDIEVTVNEHWFSEAAGELRTADTTYPKGADETGDEYIVTYSQLGRRGIVYADPEPNGKETTKGNPNVDKLEIDVTAIRNWDTFLDSLTEQEKERLSKDYATLRNLKNGEVFADMEGTEWIVCEQASNDYCQSVVVARKDRLPNKMPFEYLNWDITDRKKYLNGEYYERLKQVFGEENIQRQAVPLRAMDGTNGYGISFAYVSEMTFDQFRKYQQYIADYENTGCGIVTPSTTSSSAPDPCVYGYMSGNLRPYTGKDPLAIRPVLALNANMTIRRKPKIQEG